MTTLSRSLVLGCSVLALAACGPDEIASPGTGGNITINNPAPAPTPTPTPTPTSGPSVTPANGCPTIADPQGLTDEGTITSPNGDYRVCAMPAVFNVSSTLPYVAGLLYRMPGRVDVGTDGGATDTGTDTNVELTIAPGAIIYASGASFLNVNRGNTIAADGTADRPIIFTSRDDVLGLNGNSSSGQWGGIVLSGRAPVTDCIAPGATPGTAACERQVEGAANPALFGGNTRSDSSGSLSYVQIRYSGFVLSGDSELQSLTTGGTGSGTKFSHIQSVNSSDDGVEFFGGIVNMKYLVVAGPEDDALDTDTGVQANLQYVIAAQRPSAGDTMIEADSSNGLEDQTPRQHTQLVNATLIQRNDADQVVRIRGGADYSLVNTLIVDDSPSGTPCIRVDDQETVRAANAGLDDMGPPVFESVALDCATPFRDGSDGVTAAQIKAFFDAGSNNDDTYTNSLVGVVNGTSEDGYTAYDATALSSFFETTDFIGAATQGSTWWQGWTCDSSAITFGNNTGACNALPVYN